MFSCSLLFCFVHSQISHKIKSAKSISRQKENLAQLIKVIKLEPSNLNSDSCPTEIKLRELAVSFSRGYFAEC